MLKVSKVLILTTLISGLLDKTEPCIVCNGDDYFGSLSETISGKTCQAWDSSVPHQHSYHPSQYPNGNLIRNYCRNPAGGLKPWCYTTDPATEWEYCDLQKCTNPDGSIFIPRADYTTSCKTGKGINYRGKVSTTRSGLTCARWSSQTPHRHSYTPDNYPCDGLEENYCRNPSKDFDGGPWCYTTNPDKRWELCDIPNCETGPERCVVCNGDYYFGYLNRTLSGKTCQAWSSSEPHRHSYHPSQYPNGNLKRNYCRNPASGLKPWCYTTDPATEWEYCDLQRCTDPDGSILIPRADYTTSCKSGRGINYRGKVSTTRSGFTCARWSSQTPHRHSYTPDNYPCDGLEENDCRNPSKDFDGGPWCYTTNPNKRWEVCDIPECGPECAARTSKDQLDDIGGFQNGP